MLTDQHPHSPQRPRSSWLGQTPGSAPVWTNFQSGARYARDSFLKCCRLPENMQIGRWGKPCAGWVTTWPCLAGKGCPWRVPSTCFFSSWMTTKAWEAPQTSIRHDTGASAGGGVEATRSRVGSSPTTDMNKTAWSLLWVLGRPVQRGSHPHP